MLDDAGNTEQVRRIYLLFFISSIGIVTLVSLGLLALKQGNCSLGSLDLLLAFLLIGNLIHVRIYKRYESNIHFGIFFTAILFVYALLTGGISNTGFVWYYPFPLIASFLLGSKRGAVATGLIFAVALLFFAFFDTPPPYLASYSFDFKIRFVSSFLVVFAFSYLFEYSREKNLEELKRAQDDLEIRVQERTAELVKLQQQLVQSQKMEAVGKLAGGIAHDFNNLLTIIRGFTELSLNAPPGSEPLQEYLDEVLKASQRAADMTRQLLAFSRRQIFEIKVLDLNAVLGELSKMLGRMVGENIHFQTRTIEPLGKIKTDPGQIEQVIINLCFNARDAMPEGGQLLIETSNVDLDDTDARNHPGMKPGRYVMLAVSDNGIGMTPEVKEHIFEPFFTTKAKGRGTGLGLAMVYGIVKQSGGYILVYTEPRKGSTFRIYLPRVEEEPPVAPAAGKTHPPLPRGKETVLLVEDELPLRRFAQKVLRRQGYEVLEAADGEEALNLMREKAERTIDLLLTDVVMPKMGGQELADRLRAMKPGMRVLYISGYTEHAISQNGVLKPGVNYLSKPFSQNDLSRKVREVLDRAPA